MCVNVRVDFVLYCHIVFKRKLLLKMAADRAGGIRNGLLSLKAVKVVSIHSSCILYDSHRVCDNLLCQYIYIYICQMNRNV